MKLPLSVCLIVRDEERALPACLESVAPFVAEIIVVDTGSTDRTSQIALGFGARVADFVWCDDFAAARNFATSLANQPRILTLDADERLDVASLPALEAYCRTPDPVIRRVLRTNLADDESTPLSVESISRLYPNTPAYRHHGRVHEQILHNGSPAAAIQTGVRLLHYGYAPTALAGTDKVARNLRLLELARADEPTNAYLAYQIGRTQQAAGRFGDAAVAYRAALAQLDGAEPAETPYLSSLLLQLGYALLEQRDLGAVFDVLSLATELYPSFTDLYFLYALTLLELDDGARLAGIRLSFEHCLALGEPDPRHYETVPGVGSYRALFNLGIFHESLGDNAAATACFERAAELEFAPAVERINTLSHSAGNAGTGAPRPSAREGA